MTLCLAGVLPLLGSVQGEPEVEAAGLSHTVEWGRRRAQENGSNATLQGKSSLFRFRSARSL